MSVKKGLNANKLKLIAMLAMTVDHVTSVVFPDFPKSTGILLLHIIGRVAAPVFWFFIAEGYYHTRNVGKYIARLLLLAVISHFAYNFAFGIPFIPFKTSVFNQTSHFWALALGLIALALRKSENPRLKPWIKESITFVICILAFCANWSSIAVLVIIAIGENRGNFKKQMASMVCFVALYAAVYFLFIDKVYGAIQLFVALAIPLLKMYNGERGSMKLSKWLFYVYYPLHLALCGIIRILLHGNIGVMVGG